jgi:threonylcarbamoyladenosine tRNA methylthiotransferase MtaB
MENNLHNLTFAIHTLGCKVNACESEAIREQLLACGAVETSFDREADIYVVNTCTVTNIADRKSRQMLHRAKALSPRAVVLATGCYVQEHAKDPDADPAVDVFVANRRKGEVAQVLNEVVGRLKNGESGPFFFTEEPKDPKAFEDLPPVHSGERTRAFVKVQDGCNQFCTYCIIPFARGRICSRPLCSVITEVKQLAAEGITEVVINGIHLSSYGLESKSAAEQVALRPNDGEHPLLALIRSVSEVEGIRRVRLGSLEPRILTEETVAGLAKIDKLCPQFHLSLQSGCDKTLAAMKRRYTTAEYEEVVRRLREHFPDPAITTDIIVGFPQESEEDFAESVEYVRKIGFAQVHVFPFSRRKGTVADRMDGQLTEAEKKRRAGIMIAAAEECKREYRMRQLHKPAQVLFEETADIEGTEYYVGYSREYVPYAVKSDDCLSNIELTVSGISMLADGTVLAQ